MLDLDGARFLVETCVFEYNLPAPFGPDRGPAFLKISAKPASAQNTEYKSGLDQLLMTARKRDILREKRFERTNDVDDYVVNSDKDVREINRAVMELSYDHCIVDWQTNIQNSGKNLVPDRDNFLSLCEFAHPEISKIITRIRDDLTDFGQWQSEAETEAEAEELGNSSTS